MNIYTETTDAGEEITRKIPTLRYYTVFHIDQCDGIKPKYTKENVEIACTVNPDEKAEKIVTQYEQEVTIKRDELSDEAFYRPSQDYIRVPMISQYDSVSEYYSTLFHEMVHSTGHSTRLGRFGADAKVASFGSTEYSKEELVAEIGAATLVNYCGLETESSLRNSAGYIQGWMKAIKDDPTLIVVASGKAEKAVDYILDDVEEEAEEQ